MDYKSYASCDASKHSQTNVVKYKHGQIWYLVQRHVKAYEVSCWDWFLVARKHLRRYEDYHSNGTRCDCDTEH